MVATIVSSPVRTFGSPDVAPRALAASEAARTYYSLNPGLFGSDESWSYRDLQQLCVSLGINAAGKRASLETRLEKAHREGRHGRVHGAGLFHDEEVNVTSPSKISPRLLSPLVKTPLSRSQSLVENRPSSILRRQSSYNDLIPTPLRHASAASLKFSPFNKVHVIPPKEETENFGRYCEPVYQGIGDAVWDEDEDVWMNDGL
ncbi:hypothetical protein T492DRAFT_1053444 [Pavlovales sp. CCMP2436]|nr:hypothetical protein T492DRAFT_1053444 [Pavlovales sp. CCMP2436]|mmetsp:Transcript_12400/g.31373  ORF Transcript_12400/g.31373 Transcript_12400/m.31373 type:complete len:203 (-) Transcript_12400:232-840(-)